MNRILFFVLFFLPWCLTNAQNLVRNPGFETYSAAWDSNALKYGFRTACLTYDEFSRYTCDWQASYFTSLRNVCWDSLGLKKPLHGKTKKYENEFDTAHLVHSGMSSANMLIFKSRPAEQLEGWLKDTLCAGCEYNISFYIYVTQASNVIMNNFGFAFIHDSLRTASFYIVPNEKFFLHAQLKLQQGVWQKVSYRYKANGTERYFMLSNYITKKKIKPIKEAADGEYFMSVYIDDVVVEPMSFEMEQQN